MGTKNSKNLTILELSDVHLGHSRTPTFAIIENLRAVLNEDRLATVDMVVIAGDFYDKLLYYPAPDVALIERWIIDFLRICARLSVKVRVLEGTPKHDRKQNLSFVTLNEAYGFGVDLKYHDVLTIEYMETYDQHWLYIPDEWRSNCDDTWVEVKRLLSEHGLVKVDFAVMHGMFEYQLPAHLNLDTHKSDRYLDIVKFFVFIGHVHQASHYKRILAAGSFDRICQGDEIEKGCWQISVDLRGVNHGISWVKNPNPWTYITFDFSGVEIEDAFKQLKTMQNQRTGSYIRIVAELGHPIFDNIKLLQEQYTGLIFHTDIKKDKKYNTAKAKLFEKTVFSEIRSDNIVELLSKRIDQGTGDVVVKNRAMEILSELKG
ncbi:hypothetical protein [Endozoicomonas sp. ONNA1]|uniref:hypothetical protein n=1 Tax=Endozoicomonas sp. ONNA1 TaxID=2828740 RepID=UPI0021489C98|nr:hypothetical protein [Endozoicomonas sp. ONNA1]